MAGGLLNEPQELDSLNKLIKIARAALDRQETVLLGTQQSYEDYLKTYGARTALAGVVDELEREKRRIINV